MKVLEVQVKEWGIFQAYTKEGGWKESEVPAGATAMTLNTNSMGIGNCAYEFDPAGFRRVVADCTDVNGDLRIDAITMRTRGAVEHVFTPRTAIT